MTPAKYFVCYLLSQPDAEPVVVKEICAGMHLPWVSDEVISKLLGEMEPRPEPYRPGQRDPETDTWLRQHRIHSMWYRTKPAIEAMAIASDPELVRIAQAVALSPLPYKSFDTIIDGRFTRRGHQYYRHYFFDLSLLDPLKIKMLAGTLGTFATIAHSSEPDPSLAQAMLAHALGQAPFETTAGIIGKKVMNIAAYKLLQLSRGTAGRYDAAMMFRYARSVLVGQEIMSRSEAAAMNFMDEANDSIEFDLGLPIHDVVSYNSLVTEPDLEDDHVEDSREGAGPEGP